MKPSLLLAIFTFIAFGLVRSASAADALPSPLTDVLLIDHGKVDNTFATGGPFLLNKLYKVQAGRRVMAGKAEIHTRDTDIFYVTEGTATFVTGGTAVEPKETGLGEILGKSITGGTEHHLTKGDIIVIPSGTPHQFTEVNGLFLYFVVKVTQ